MKHGQELKAHVNGRNDISIDVSGSHGRRGSDGSSGSDGIFSGRNGGNGFPGDDGTPGVPAGDVTLTLSENTRGAMKVSGTVSREVPVQSGIAIAARGGNGGNGGNGARPGSGGSAGHGGHVRLTATRDDSYLFSLVDSLDIKAGRPGAAGTPGRAGYGGAGGSGGSSYTWYTEHTEYDTVQTEYETQDGGTAFRTERVPRTVQDSHTNPGGSSGYTGSSGSSGPTAQDGMPAVDGDYEFIVVHDDGRRVPYKQLYNLTLNNYRVRDASRDRNFEPGERGFVEGLSTYNSGGMPTPPQTKSLIRLNLRGDGGHSPLDSSLIIPKSLDVREPYQFESGLSFIVNDINGPSVNKPYRSSFTVSPAATLEPTDRGFSHFHNDTVLDSRFPVEIKVSAPPALAQSETGKVFLEIRNTTDKPLGLSGETRRLISLLIKEEPDQSSPMQFTDPKGNPISLAEGVTHAIDNLGPGETRRIEGRIRVPSDFRPQSAYTFDTFLNLERQDENKEMRPVQKEIHRLSVASKYETDPNADFILIVNNETTEDEITEWRRLLETELGFKVATWNIAYYGNFDLDAERIKDPRWHLLRDFKGKTVVVLNNKTKSYSGKWVTAWDNLSKDAILKATGLKESNFLVLGNMDPASAKERMESTLMKGRAGEGSRNYNSTQALYEGIKIDHAERLDGSERAKVKGDFHRVKVVDNFYWETPSEPVLKRRAEKVAANLGNLFPNRRYAVSYNFKGDVLKKGGAVRSSRVYLGDIEVQRLPDKNDKVVTTLDIDDAALHRPQLVRGEKVMHALMDSLSTADKLKAFDRLNGVLNKQPNDEQIAAVRCLGEGLINDILSEYQDTLKGSAWQMNPSPRTLQALRNWTPKNSPKADTYADKMMISLYARAALAGKYSYSGVPYMGGRAKGSVKAALSDLEAWGHNMYPDKKDWKRFNAEVEKKKAALEKEAQTGGWSWNSTNHKRINGVTRIHKLTDIVDTTDILQGDRVIPQSALESIEIKDRTRKEEWNQLLDDNQAARRELKTKD
ncbi:MAG: hypothetical protein HYZ71_10370 [Deltaproteobacteria bacterium]|nr:hypothetical protein [Deltaproteobacteria bacterium]